MGHIYITHPLLWDYTLLCVALYTCVLTYSNSNTIKNINFLILVYSGIISWQSINEYGGRIHETWKEKQKPNITNA